MICGIGDGLADAAALYGWQKYTSSWQEVVGDPEVDLVATCTPGNTHCEITVAAARNRKHVFCEKPLALNREQAAEMLRAAEQAGVKHLVNFNYRRVPAVMLAKKLIDEGRIGAIYHFRGAYYQDWPLDPGFPFLWRMDREIAGAGSMADKGSHLVDLARYLAGEFTELAACSEIFVKERPLPGRPGEQHPVTTDDAAAWIARFDNGALGVFHTSRMSAGHKNSLGFEVNGSQGSIRFDLERLNELEVYFASDPAETSGFRTVMVTELCHPYLSHWWPPGHVIGWESTFVHQYCELLKAIAGDYQPAPSFYDGLKAQEILDAIGQATAERRWVATDQPTATARA